MYEIIVFQGPSGSGKTTLQHKIGLPRVITWTTRTPREGERDGTDYYFVSIEQFRRAHENGKLLEVTEYKSNFYGTPLESIVAPKHDVQSVVLDANGARQVEHLLKGRCLRVGIYASKTDCETRLTNRQFCREGLQQRLADYEQEVYELNECDLIINNSVTSRDTSAWIIDALRRSLFNSLDNE